MAGSTLGAEPPAAVFRIDAWWVDAGAGTLRRDDRVVRIEPRVMDVLVYLARRPGEVISREELEREVWRGAVVGYDAVTKTLTKLRRALGDTSRDPQYIETVPKRGYRLIAGVDRSAAAQAPASDASAPAAERPFSAKPLTRRRVGVLAGLLLATLAGLGGVLQHWRGTVDAPPAPAAPTPVAAGAEYPSPTRVVVLPFEVLGDDPDQLYLARGLTADLIADLSSYSGLRVTGGTGASSAPSADGVQYRVWGGVQRSADRIRVEVRLTEAQSGRQLAIARSDRPFEDLFAVQEDIGGRLARALSPKLSEAEQQRIAHRYTRSVSAYDLFLRAQAHLLVRTPDDNAEARRLYLLAIGEDPAFARAYGGVALTYAAEYRNQWGGDGQAQLGRALSMAETAHQIDPSLPEVHWTMGYVKAQQRRHEAALADLDQALRLDPTYADALALKGGIYTYIGQPGATIPPLRQAMRLNPGAGYLYFMILGRAYFYSGDPVQAVINLREAAARNPEVLEVRVYLTAALESAGEHDEAAWQAEEVRAIQPDFRTADWLRSYPMTDEGQRQQLIEATAPFGL